ncbi:DUF2252 domain-containing protein [Dechloromonas sp. A34]|uniref:DUF2252 domain-containing protein n=1 Tax=Dechloromonas sp. A34 TaxID=447588 RepID=UPI0022495ECE|nr:DUF2252 family protein [Dechloromonas sp. A34]
MNPIIEAIRKRDSGRDPERLTMRYAKMKESPFVFLRGACHLFYDALPDAPVLDRAPLAWCCGDLHFENFGSYKADNRLVYFDINDFDESALAPCTWDIVRLLTSIRCGAETLRATEAETRAVASDCLHSYRAALLRGKPLWVEGETSSGLIHDLFVALAERKRENFLDRRTILDDGQRRIKIDGIKALAVAASERDKVTAFMKRWAAEQPKPGFFKVLDVARRIAGTGSLGVTRYVILVDGKGSPDENYLLDLKATHPSSLLPRLRQIDVIQPVWQDEARRIATIQNRLQAVDHAFLQPVTYDGQPCILRDLQPSEDRVAIGDWGKKLDRLRDVVYAMGNVLAWDQLRASGRGGAASADQLSDFAQGERWMSELLETVDAMTKTTHEQWETFRQSAL